MSKEQMAEQIVNLAFDEDYGDGSLTFFDMCKSVAIRALELAEQSAEKRLKEATQHQEKRIAELEAENERLREEKIFVGYTNGYQLFYAAATEDENSMPCGQGSFYRDTDNDTTIPLYMLATHKHRIETTSNGSVTYEMIKALRGDAEGVRKPHETAMYHAAVSIRKHFGEKP